MLPFKFLPIALLLLMPRAIAAPQKPMNTPRSRPQKQLQTEFWHLLDTFQNPTPAQLQQLETLLKKGAPLNSPDPKSGLYPLQAAVFDLKTVALFLKYGAQPNVADKDGATPLHLAAMMGAPGTAKKLIGEGAQPEARNKNGETPLLAAAFMMANVSNARDLIAAGANPNARDKRGATALNCAAILENGAPLIKLLLDAGAQVDARETDGTTPLMAAALMNRADIVKLLLSRGADAKARDKRGHTALDGAQTLPILASVAAQNETRKLSPDEQKTRDNARRIVEMLKAAAKPEAKSAPLPQWKSTEWQERIDAAEALGQSADSQADETLLTLLKDPDAMVREAVMMSLGALWTAKKHASTLTNSRLIAALLECAHSPLGQKTPILRRDVVETLADMGDDAIIAAARPFLRDADAGVRLRAIKVAGGYGDREALPVLRIIARNDTAQADNQALQNVAKAAVGEIEKGKQGKQ